MRPKRFAIVIGNSKYPNLGDIKGARKDAIDIYNALVSLDAGWEFGPCGEPVIDATRQKMYDAEGWLISKVEDEIRRDNRNCQTLIYFAGHGKVIDGDTYLLPCDYERPDCRGDENSQRKMKFPVELMLQNLNRYKNRLNMIVDACRTEDYASRDGSDTLIAPRVPGSIVCFGTSFGSKAREDRNGNGWFTGKLLPHIAEPGVQIYELLHRACQSVEDEYGEAQRPTYQIEFHGVAYFAEPRASASVQRPPAVPAAPKARPAFGSEEFRRRLSKAEAGDAVEQCWIGYCYQNGLEGVGKDMNQAVIWYRKSAQGGYADGMYNLGWCYQNGLGVAKDLNQAVIWYRKSAEGGCAAGMCNLGRCYKNGWGVAKDLNQAAIWYRKSAEGGRPDGMAFLADAFRTGSGVAKDVVVARRWIEAAVAAGSRWAIENRGLFD